MGAVSGIGAGGGELDAIIDGSIVEVTSNAMVVKPYSFYSRSSLESVNLPKLRMGRNLINYKLINKERS